MRINKKNTLKELYDYSVFLEDESKKKRGVKLFNSLNLDIDKKEDILLAKETFKYLLVVAKSYSYPVKRGFKVKRPTEKEVELSFNFFREMGKLTIYVNITVLTAVQ